jgi:hypothetical protein
MTTVESGPQTTEKDAEWRTQDGAVPPGETDATGGDDWAICCSGGGIRSAAYCLGALQSLDSLDNGGLLGIAKWIVGVSGGSYIASSRALVAHNLPTGAVPHAYAPGTAEERNFRDNTRYIAPNGATMLVGVLSLLLGAIATFIIVTAPIYAFTHAWGWLLRWQGVLVPSGSRAMTAAVTGNAWWLPSAIVGGITLVLFAFWWLTVEPPLRRSRTDHEKPDDPDDPDDPDGAPWWAWLRPNDPDRSANRAKVVSWAALLTAGLALAMLAVPPLISWLTRSTGSFGTVARAVGFGTRPTWSLAAVTGLIAAIAAIAKFCQTGLAKWNSLSGQAKSSAAGQPGFLTTLAGSLRQKLLPWLASAVIVLGGAVLALLWISDGARSGFTTDQLLQVIGALVVMVVGRAAVNVNRISLHDVYRWRLANAFAVTRKAAQEHNPVKARRLFAKAAATRLSQLRDRADDEPELVICGTANINADREVPPGSGGFCVSFDPKHVTLRRDTHAVDKKDAQTQTSDSEKDAKALTSDYEALIGQRRTTLFDISAISGAAVSPLMGSATQQAYRILLTATNVRLGVWLPHPTLVQAARNQIDQKASKLGEPDRPWTRRPLLLLLWYLSPHPLWARKQDRNDDREARLWAHVLKLRLREKPTRRDKLAGELCYRLMQPTAGLLWSEAVGHLSYRDTWMYVTDGGHYDNLGLVEALRRGARHIVVLDASGDKADTWFTLGGSMALARSDAGVDIDLDPTTMVKGGSKLAAGQVVRPWAYGTFTRPASAPGLPEQGQIWVCKLGWWSGAPWDVLAYAKDHSTYPCDSTLEQLYDAAEFEAYLELGGATVLAAAQKCRPPLKCPVPAGPGSPAAPHSPVPAGPGVPPAPRQNGNGSGT